jgi:hypothetical protein
MQAQYIYQSHTISISAVAQRVKFEFETDTRGKRIVGVALTFSTLSIGGEVQLRVDSQEYLPENFPAVLLASLPFNGVEERFMLLDAPAGGKKVDGQFQDRSPIAGFVAYSVTLTLKMTR